MNEGVRRTILRDDPKIPPELLGGSRVGGVSDAEALKRRFQESGLVKEPLLSRRGFLGGVAAASSIAAVGAMDWKYKYSTLSKLLDDKLIGQYDYDEVVKEAKQFLSERYGITLVVGQEENQRKVVGARPHIESYKVAIRIALEELAKYPPEMIKQLGGKRGVEIRILHEPFAQLGPSDGPESPLERVGGLALVPKVDLPVSIVLGSDNPRDYQRETVHHEFNHQFANRWQSWEDRKRIWKGFHADVTDTPYFSDRNQSGSPVVNESYFLNLHAAKNFSEDQAVFAAAMIMPLSMADFLDRWRAERNPKVKDILTRKYNETKKNYFDWSQGKIGEEFWVSIIREGNRLREERKRGGSLPGPAR